MGHTESIQSLDWVGQQTDASILANLGNDHQLSITRWSCTADLCTQGKPGQVIVVELNASLDALESLQILQLQFRSTPIIAIVNRQRFELGIAAKGAGALAVVADDDFSAATWTPALTKMAVAKPALPRRAYIYVDPMSQNLFELAQRVARANVSVLIQGATGTGKEVLARVIHESSARCNEPFVSLNCAAIPEQLIEDMLFGHEKGAFTGASRRQRGLFEQAQGGSLFLDEIGEMPHHLQVKLLRVLQERNLMRIGGEETIELDVRIIAATNRNLAAAIAEKVFREDLYFRLSAFKLTIPPLAQRPLDIAPLVQQALVSHSPVGVACQQITMAALRTLQAYSWPGNVRELENVVARAFVLSDGGTIDVPHILLDDVVPYELTFGANRVAIDLSNAGLNSDVEPAESQFYRHKDLTLPASMPFGEQLQGFVRTKEMQAILGAIKTSHSRIEAADRLGISARTLRHKLKKLRDEGFDVPRTYAR